MTAMIDDELVDDELFAKFEALFERFGVNPHSSAEEIERLGLIKRHELAAEMMKLYTPQMIERFRSSGPELIGRPERMN